jgi:hypothetical protein
MRGGKHDVRIYDMLNHGNNLKHTRMNMEGEFVAQKGVIGHASKSRRPEGGVHRVQQFHVAYVGSDILCQKYLDEFPLNLKGKESLE